MIATAQTKRHFRGNLRLPALDFSHPMLPATRLSLSTVRLTVSILLLILVSGCTNSKLVLSPIYNRLDDQMRGEFHKLAKWNASQIEHFELRAGTFHVWHRQEELPKYAALLNNIQSTVRVRDETTQTDINNWIDTVERFSQDARRCHPVNFSYDLMQTLTDEQVNFIERRFASERKKNYAKYLALTADERRKERVKNVVKWAGRIGFDFNKTQKRMLDETMGKQISLRNQYYRLVDKWARDLFIIARQQQAPDYEQKMRAQVNQLWTLLEKNHNEEWQANRELWRGFGYDFVRSLSYDQRIQASNWVRKLGGTIRSISRLEPSFKVTNDPNHGCAVGGTVSG